MVILSESKEMCEEIWRLLTKTTRINGEGDRLQLADEKTVRSGSNENISIAGVNFDMIMYQLFFTPTCVAGINRVRSTSLYRYHVLPRSSNSPDIELLQNRYLDFYHLNESRRLCTNF